jgi:protein O-GlcNAc transferase
MAAYVSGDSERALTVCEAILRVRPNDLETLNALGVIKGSWLSTDQAENRLKRAEALLLFERAVALAPQDARLHNNLGNADKDFRRYPEALACYDRALELLPGFGPAHFHRGWIPAALRSHFRMQSRLFGHRSAYRMP